MPKLLVFVACEKVIIDQAQLPSLISLFQRMKIQLQDAPLPENAISPAAWSMFSLWQHTEDEIDKEYSQRVEVFVPSGQLYGYAEVKFKVTSENDLQSKNTFQFFGVPINDEGFVRIVTTLDGSSEPVAEYSFFVEHLTKEKHGPTDPETEDAAK